MINIGSDTFECETLFLQPTWSCQKNCFGCYVKEKEQKFGSEEIDIKLWGNIFTHLSLPNSKIQTNQVTIALDTLPSIPYSYTWNKMYDIAQLYKIAIQYNCNPNIKYHLTINTVSDLASYTGSGLFKGLDMVSVSNINNLDDIKLIRECTPGAKINWNVLSSTFNKKSPDQIKDILTNVNQAYLLLLKAPLGYEGHDFESIWESLRKIPNMFPRDTKQETDKDSCSVPPLINKIILDGCIRDAYTSKLEKTGCASNLSRFQIWPNGRVTGCAYNSHEQYGKKVESFEDILDNLRDARTRYEFSKCTIPNMGLVKLAKNNNTSISP